MNNLKGNIDFGTEAVMFHMCESIKANLFGSPDPPPTSTPAFRVIQNLKSGAGMDIYTKNQKATESFTISIKIKFCPFCGKHLSDH